MKVYRCYMEVEDNSTLDLSPVWEFENISKRLVLHQDDIMHNGVLIDRKGKARHNRVDSVSRCYLDTSSWLTHHSTGYDINMTLGSYADCRPPSGRYMEAAIMRITDACSIPFINTGESMTLHKTRYDTWRLNAGCETFDKEEGESWKRFRKSVLEYAENYYVTELDRADWPIYGEHHIDDMVKNVDHALRYMIGWVRG